MVSEPLQSWTESSCNAPYSSQSQAPRLDAENPWPGLAAYDEESRKFFHGRNREAVELLRMIRLSPLTTLYGKSGLGKSSLLQAGLFPLLRQQHYLPVYLHVDFSNEATDLPLEQVARRLGEELVRAGAECPQRREGEGLWEYLHREDMEIWSKDNFLLTPVLVFDQFEELFSGKIGDVARVQQVRDDLADLIENRIPVELASNEAKTRQSRLNLISQHYRVVISFREDYLPDLKSWEECVPSLLRNYLRLERMTRQCAIETVRESGQTVLDDGVAPLIVDFVGKVDKEANEDNEAVIEPVLLCLCCYQLNRRRNGDEKISRKLVESAGQDILDSFYRESLDDDDVKGPPDVATFIEGFLVQGDRFRGNYPKAEAINGKLLKQTQLDALTDRHRLLRVVQYADTARIELIHDRLVDVVCKARNERKIREWRAEQKRQATHATVKLKRRLQGAVAAIALILLVLGGLLYRSYNLWEETRPWASLDSAVTGLRYPLSQDVANIGRPAEKVMHLIRQVPLYAQPVSRIHLMIFRNHYAIDMRSLYGTTVNGEFLPYGDQRQLTDGDVIVLAGAAAFLFHPLTYQAWQFFWDPWLSQKASSTGWGLLIDSRRRLVFSLTQDNGFITPVGESGVEPRDGQEGAIAIVRRRSVVDRVAVSLDKVAVGLFEKLPDDPGQTEIQMLALSLPRTTGSYSGQTWLTIEDMETFLTIEDVADGQALEADIKLDDYSYGRFVVPQGKQYFYLQSSRGRPQHTVTELAFHQGKRRFQVIWLDSSIESPTSNGAR
jgi:hypothetical protein